MHLADVGTSRYLAMTQNFTRKETQARTQLTLLVLISLVSLHSVAQRIGYEVMILLKVVLQHISHLFYCFDFRTLSCIEISICCEWIAYLHYAAL